MCLLLLLPPSSSLPVLFLFPLPSFSLISPPLSVGPILCSIQCCSGQHCREALRVPLQGELTLCACVCVCVHYRACTRAYVCACVCAFVDRVFVRMCVCACMCAFICAYVCVCACTSVVRACLRACVRACMSSCLGMSPISISVVLSNVALIHEFVLCM